MNRKFFITLFCAVFSLFGLAACQSVPATPDDSAETATFNGGMLTVWQEGSFRSLANATRETLEAFQNVTITREEVSTVDGLFIARGPNNERITVHLRKINPHKTQLKIRYGWRGSLEDSQIIFAEIDQRAAR